MDEKTYQAPLNNITERLARLENELKELRQLILFQGAQIARPIDKLSPKESKSDLPEPAVAGSDCWEVTCFGTFHLRCAGRDFMLCSSRKGQSILKYLLASPGYTASTETLIECFWPQGDTQTGARSLQVAVHALRRSLHGAGPQGGNETILFRNNCYFLNPALSIIQDVNRFRAAYEHGQHAANAGQRTEARLAFEEARALYTGSYHADCYEGWASSHRIALQDMLFALLSHLGSLYSRGEDWEHATACYREILAVDCYREDIYRQLMRCYAAWGRQADVKRTYHACQECLQRDLRLAPASETTRLYQHLLQHPVVHDTH